MARVAGRMRRRATRGVFGRISLGTAGASPRLRRWVLAAALVGVALLGYPALGGAGVAPAATCRSGCRGGSVSGMVGWTRALPGSWQVLSGLTGTVPASGQAYLSVGDGIVALGDGLAVDAYSSATGEPLWQDTLAGFPAGAAIVSVRTWPGEVTAGVAYTQAGRSERTEVVISGPVGVVTGRYPAAPFGGAVAGSPKFTVVVGTTAVTSYDNATGRVRWQVSTGQVLQTWHDDGGTLYVAESSGGFLGSAPVTALRQINLSTGAEQVVRPLVGLSFDGTFSLASDRVVLFSSAAGVNAYYGPTGAWLWSLAGAIPEGTDPAKHRIYLTRGSSLIAVNPVTGQVTATASGSAADGSAGMYVVRDGVALGLDQGASGDAWGYDIAVQRVTLAATGLPWPHYFVDLGGIGGSADPSGDQVIIAACAQLAAGPPSSPSPSSPSPSTSTPTSTGSAPPTSTFTASPSPSLTPSPSPSPSSTASSAPGQGCLRPELVGLNL